jgi:hypothetical protein
MNRTQICFLIAEKHIVRLAQNDMLYVVMYACAVKQDFVRLRISKRCRNTRETHFTYSTGRKISIGGSRTADLSFVIVPIFIYDVRQPFGPSITIEREPLKRAKDR